MLHLFAVTPDEIVKLAYDAHSKALTRISSVSVGWARRATRLNESIILAGRSRIDLLSTDLTLLKSSDVQSLSAMAAGDRHVYAADEGCLICLDESLREVGLIDIRLHPALFFGGKGIDDILVYGDMVYLIDDLVSPLYVFMVDASDKNNLCLTSYHYWEGTNANLSLQFINPELNQWIVKEDCGHMGGSGETLHVFDLVCAPQGGSACSPIPIELKRRARRLVFSWWTLGNRAPKGYRIKDVTPFPPHWSVVEDIHGDTYLAKLNTTSERMRFSFLTPLIPACCEPSSPWDRGPGFLVRRGGDLLFVTLKQAFEAPDLRIAGGTGRVPLFIFCIGKRRPTLVAEVNLGDLGVTGVYDLVVV